MLFFPPTILFHCSSSSVMLSSLYTRCHNPSFAWLIESFNIAVFISKDVSITSLSANGDNEINNQMKW